MSLTSWYTSKSKLFTRPVQLEFTIAFSRRADGSAAPNVPLEQAQDGLRAANDRFNEEVIRMNTDMASIEDALEERGRKCK